MRSFWIKYSESETILNEKDGRLLRNKGSVRELKEIERDWGLLLGKGPDG